MPCPIRPEARQVVRLHSGFRQNQPNEVPALAKLLTVYAA